MSIKQALEAGGHFETAPLVLDGPINRIGFETYVDKVLVPELRPGDIVIMNNLSSHKGPRVREMIEAAGASLLYPPPCSPDFDPISSAIASNAVPSSAARRWSHATLTNAYRLTI